METRTLGTHGPAVSIVGLGCNNFGRTGTVTETLEGTRAVVDAAIEAGITLFDEADSYGASYGLSETLLGQALAGRHEGLVIATKWGHTDYQTEHDAHGPKGSRAYIRASVEGSLRRLGIERIDLFQHHTPDPLTPIADTLTALDELVTEGKIAAYGHSNYSAAQIAEAADAAVRLGVAPFVSAQDHYNLVTRGVEREVLPAAEAAGLGFLPYFPLHNGLFTGKFTRTERPADTRIGRLRPKIAEDAPWDAMEAFADFARARGITMLDASFGWFLAHPVLSSVIAGATRPEQVAQNAAAGARWRPSAEELAEIEAMFPLD